MCLIKAVINHYKVAIRAFYETKSIIVQDCVDMSTSYQSKILL